MKILEAVLLVSIIILDLSVVVLIFAFLRSNFSSSKKQKVVED